MPKTETNRLKAAAGIKKKSASASASTGAKTKKGKSSTYNKYLNETMAELKKKDPSKDHKERMKQALEMWRKEEGGKTK